MSLEATRSYFTNVPMKECPAQHFWYLLEGVLFSKHGEVLQKFGFPCALKQVLGSQGIRIKCTAGIFFPTVDSK